MDEQQAFRAIRNAIRLENLGRDTAAKVTPQLRQAYTYLQDLIANLPEEAIGRELRYRQLSDLIRATLEPVSQTALNETKEAIVEEIPHQLQYAEKIIGEGDQLPPMQLTRTQLMEMATDTEVLGKRIDQLFGEGTFTRAQVTKVDKVVKQGFLLGETNQQIARNLATAFNGSRRDVTAVTRTAVMDMSQRAHERFWDANSDRIKMWEFDATFDYRVCPLCYPNDGKRSKDRGNLPTVPVHPNCRCRVIPLTATALALEKQDLKEGMQVSTVQIGKPEHVEGGGGKPRVYKTKAKVDGKKVQKFAKEYTTPRGERPTMGFFLEKANTETRVAVLGKDRAAFFQGLVKGGKSPEDALIEAVKSKGKKASIKARAAALKAAKKAKPVTKKVATKKPQKLTSEQINADLKKAKALADAQTSEAQVIINKRKAAEATAKTKQAAEATLNKQGRTGNTNYDYDKNWEKLGYEKKSQYRKAKEDIVEWSGNEFEGVRAAQFADARDRGVELNNYERLQTRRLEKGEQRTAGNRARRLENFIDRAPKYDGTIRRGVALDSREDALNMVERYSSGKKNLAIESWTTDEGVSHRFAMGNGDPRPHRMTVLVENNSKGAPINAISGFDDEFEVLVPSGVRYEVVNVEEKFVKGTGKKNPISGVDHTDWTVILREVKD